MIQKECHNLAIMPTEIILNVVILYVHMPCDHVGAFMLNALMWVSLDLVFIWCVAIVFA